MHCAGGSNGWTESSYCCPEMERVRKHASDDVKILKTVTHTKREEAQHKKGEMSTTGNKGTK